VNHSNAVWWTKPDDYEYDEQNPASGLIGLHPSAFLVGFADGSVRFLRSSISPEVLKGLFSRNGGENVSDQVNR